MIRLYHSWLVSLSNDRRSPKRCNTFVTLRLSRFWEWRVRSRGYVHFRRLLLFFWRALSHWLTAVVPHPSSHEQIQLVVKIPLLLFHLPKLHHGLTHGLLPLLLRHLLSPKISLLGSLPFVGKLLLGNWTLRSLDWLLLQVWNPPVVQICTLILLNYVLGLRLVLRADPRSVDVVSVWKVWLQLLALVPFDFFLFLTGRAIEVVELL